MTLYVWIIDKSCFLLLSCQHNRLQNIICVDHCTYQQFEILTFYKGGEWLLKEKAILIRINSSPYKIASGNESRLETNTLDLSLAPWAGLYYPHICEPYWEDINMLPPCVPPHSTDPQIQGNLLSRSPLCAIFFIA